MTSFHKDSKRDAISDINALKDRGKTCVGGASLSRRIQRLDFDVMWTFFAMLVLGPVHPVVGKVTTNAEADGYSVRAIDSCPRLGYFLEWVVPSNALESQGTCLLCFCKDEASALCWKRDSRRCEQKNVGGVRRSKRFRRSASFLSSLLQPTIQNRNEKKYRSESCTPFKGSYSEGCPPDDWCTGCTVCDCNAQGRWDCHLLSFCGDKNKKQKEILKKVKPSKKLKYSYMRNVVKAAQRKTTKKPKLVKRIAGKPAMKATTKKPGKIKENQRTKKAFKAKAKPKPKPKRSITDSSPETRPNFDDSTLAQEVVKRVMAAIQEMTNKKYGLRPELRHIQTNSTKKPPLRFKKVTKKAPTPKPTKPTKPTKPIRRTTPKPKPKPKPKYQTQRPTTKKPQTKKPGASVKNITMSPNGKKLKDELQKIIAKAASKVYRQRHKREVTEFKEYNVDKDATTATGMIYDSTSSFEIKDLTTQKTTFLKSKVATYETKGYKLEHGSQDTFYEYSTLDDRKTNVMRDGKEEYYKYLTGATADKIDTTTSILVVNDAFTSMDKNTQKEADKKFINSKNFVKESTNDSISTVSINDQIDEPIIYSKPTEEYSQNEHKFKETPSILGTDKSNYTATQILPISTEKNIKAIFNVNSKTFQHLADYDRGNNSKSENISLMRVHGTNKALDKENSSKGDNNTMVNKPTKVIRINKIYRNLNITGFQNLVKDLGSRSTMKKKVYAKNPTTNKSVKNYFRRLFRYIFTKTKRERIIIRKTLLEKDKLNKLEIVRTICHNFGPCNMTRSTFFLIKPLLQELSTETKTIFKTIRIIKGLLYLLDMPPIKHDPKIEESERLESDMAILNSIIRGTYEKKVLGKLTNTELTQINFIKNNTDIFIASVGNFASVLYKLIHILTADVTKKGKHRQIRADVFSEKEKVQNVFKRIKDVLKEHDMAENTLIETLYQNLTKQDRNDVLHLIYKNSDIMDNYKYRVLEILGKLKEILNKIEMIKAGRRRKAMLEEERRIEEKRIAEKTKEVERQRQLSKKKQQIDSQRKEVEGIPVWNRGRPNMRRKRQLGEDRVCEYLLMIMEFLLKHSSSALMAPPVEDGIELLVTAIQNAPDIEPMPRMQPKTYHASNKTNTMKELIQKINDISSRKQNNDQYGEVKLPLAEIENNPRDQGNVNVRNIEAQKPYNLHDVEMKNLGEDRHKLKKPTGMEEDLAIPHYLATNEDDEYDHRYERQLGATNSKKANEKLEQYSEHNRNLEKVMEKMVYNQMIVGAGNDSKEVKPDEAKTKDIESESQEIKSNDDFVVITTPEPTTDDPNASTTTTETYNSDMKTSKIKSSHKIRQYNDEEYQSKPKLVWIADLLEDDNIPQTTVVNTVNSTTTAAAVTSTPVTPPKTTPILVTEIVIDTTTVTSKKIKRNSTSLSSEDIQQTKEINLHRSDQISSERYPPSSREESDEEY